MRHALRMMMNVEALRVKQGAPPGPSGPARSPLDG